MLYTGIDLIEIGRIERAIARWGERFLQRVFTANELAIYRAKPASLAARWAAKEATAKLLGVGLRGLGALGQQDNVGAVAWTDIEIMSDAMGRPTLHLHGRAAARVQDLGLVTLSLSLSHTRHYAIASVVALSLAPSSIQMI